MTMASLPVWWIWASVVIFGLHNIEESLNMERWASRNLAVRYAQHFKTIPFCIAVVLLWLIHLMLAVIVVVTDSRMADILFILGFSAIVGNGVFHLISPLFFENKPPGFWTAILLVLPLGGWTAYHVIIFGYANLQNIGLFLLIGIVLQSLLAMGALTIGRMVLN